MLFYRGRQRVLDANVNPVSGAKANFYLTGTTTRTDTYSDAGLTVEHTNPVLADSYGFLPPIHLDPDVTYKVVITDANDAELPDGTIDPLVVFGAVDDGPGSGLDADTLDDIDSTAFAQVEEGSFTATLTSMTATITGTLYYRKVGKLVTVFATANITGTSNNTSMTITGAPNSICPTGSRRVPCEFYDDANVCSGSVVVSSSGDPNIWTCSLNKLAGGAGPEIDPTGAFTSSGTKGLTSFFSITYGIE